MQAAWSRATAPAPDDRASLWSAARAAGLSGRYLSGAGATVALDHHNRGTILRRRREELRGRSVLLATADQLTAAVALLELDGVARRLILYPADLPLEQALQVVGTDHVDAVVSDFPALAAEAAATGSFLLCHPSIEAAAPDRTPGPPTEWVLLTSGTTGRPKMVAHTLASLTGAIEKSRVPASPVVWSTFYDIRRYGGLQVFLRAMLTGASLVLSSAQETTADFLNRAALHAVTHISGTPSHWRRALMSPAARALAPQYVRLSGEIADQAILDQLRDFYPHATVAHAFASTEAGVGFDVRDGLAGFPASFAGRRDQGVDIKVEEGSLRIRSPRVAACYLGPGEERRPIADPEGFVDTGDMLERRGDRYYFAGRRDGVINVGGLKVHPEEVEAVINRHPLVRMSLVRTKKSPITGALVVADVVLQTGPAPEPARQLGDDILNLCRQALPRHKVPAAIRFVDRLAVSETGKLVRRA